ncbi:MAG: DUF4271 domain-containing protein [Bacteroidales bacterium]|nr:DUF4271 domain-containing protein [Bacteroidales bacterium]
MYSRNTIDFYTAANKFSVQQDTVINNASINATLKSDSFVQKKSDNQDPIRHQTIQQSDFSSIDSIIQRSEKRELQIQEQIQAQIQEQLRKDAAIQRWYRKQNDTSEILYKEFGIADFPIKPKLDNDLTQQNFLYNFLSVKPVEKQDSNVVFVENKSNAKADYKTNTVAQQDKLKFIPKDISGRVQFDWITILLMASILLLVWIRLINKKYLLSLVKSIVSFQESITLYREKNSLMEKASFMVNLLFLSNISIFIIQLYLFYGVDIAGVENYMFYFIVIGSFVGLYIFRALTSSMIGFLFLKQNVFSEFFHNVNVYTKNSGLFLLPVVITLQFLSYDYLPFIVYTGILVVVILYLLHIIRSFQIFIRKNVSISYMILYLCAFEFSPFLIIYKIVFSLV